MRKAQGVGTGRGVGGWDGRERGGRGHLLAFFFFVVFFLAVFFFAVR